MDTPDDRDFGTRGEMLRLLEFLKHQTELTASTQQLMRGKKGLMWSVVHPLIYSIADTCGSVVWLAGAEKLRDTFVLSRVAYEGIVNVCFLFAEGESAAERAFRHAQQRAHSDLDRRVDVNGRVVRAAWTGKNSSEERVKEPRQWTRESVRERIEAVDRQFGTAKSDSLQFGLLAIYGHSSEIAHGSLFGALFALGLTQPTGKLELETHTLQNITMLLMVLGMCLHSPLSILAEELESPDLCQESDNAIMELVKRPWLAPVIEAARQQTRRQPSASRGSGVGE